MGTSYLPVAWLPLAIALWIPTSFLTTYMVAVSENHVYPWWPAISATGTLPPESCWFGLFTNISSFLLILGGYIRHVQVKEFSQCRSQIGPRLRTNLLASLIGLVSALGLFIVANWQMTNSHRIHYFGAQCCFYGANAYFIFQAVFSFWMIPEMNSFRIFVLRSILCLLMLCLNIGCIISGISAARMFKGDIKDTLMWKPSQPGYGWHISYTVMEWSLMIVFALAILTFLPDLRKIQLREPSLEVKRSWVNEN